MDWKDASDAGGLLAVAAVVWEFLWRRSDRAADRLAQSIRADEKVRKAIGDVALAHAEEAKAFPTAESHEHLRRELGEVKDLVKSGNQKIDRLVVSLATGSSRLYVRDDEGNRY